MPVAFRTMAVVRIVFVNVELPRPQGAASSRLAAAMLPALASLGVDVTCIASHEESDGSVEQACAHAESSGYELIPVPLHLAESRAQRLHASLRRPRSELARSRALCRAVEEAIRPAYDVLHLGDLYLAWAFADTPRTVLYVQNLDVIDGGNAGATMRERLERVQSRRAAHVLFTRTERIIAMTDRISHEVLRWRPGVRSPVAGPAFDASSYEGGPADAPVVGVIGSMFWQPSRAAADRVLRSLWSPIRAAVPDARLLVAGYDSERFLGHHFPLDGAELLGTVADASDLFGRSAVLLYPPPRATGVKVKVLESLACGVPVVTNDQGGEGLPDGAPVSFAETDDELVAATVGLLRDPAARRARATEGRRFVAAAFAPHVGAQRLLAAYEELGLR